MRASGTDLLIIECAVVYKSLLQLQPIGCNISCVPQSGKQLVKLLKQEGWDLIRINGSHHILGKANKTVTVPVHGNQSLGKGLEQKILKEAGFKK